MSSNQWDVCTFTTCSIKQSIFQYRPSLAANSVFIALFGLSLIIHVFEGVFYKQKTFAMLMSLGCICEMIGYGGRILMWKDPWGFNGFIIQIVCITIAPVFMTAAIYVTLYRSIMKLSPSSAAFKPAFYYQIFVPCDIVALVLQSVGGAMSSQSSGSSQAGVNIGLAGLSFQVLTLLIFIALGCQYTLRYRADAKLGRASMSSLDGRFKWVFGMVSFATLLIFIRCVYRIYELSNGYHGAALHDEGLFIGLESIMIILATFILNMGHPGMVFSPKYQQSHAADVTAEMSDSGVSTEKVKH
ncbi:hypothetical protein AUEXF2481DRAFT_8073 [Aureobasidium subglaciale EXF-2481]|uniref:RTA1 like protein n=1 Tax=Aureobasidium subglaciale (strain EXF-2481) TaxID=1043005 RepID=A0A074Y351_AURSE|nr:uncharacterized protein AUEXF2481DRAFT_8073 [Aureobasidium subglaciale EXF-2481]KEQ92110.1 hypothetical protein AUEXF2481DRAFT_8073 [Aureobasidium subglaciale EXF-2481]